MLYQRKRFSASTEYYYNRCFVLPPTGSVLAIGLERDAAMASNRVRDRVQLGAPPTGARVTRTLLVGVNPGGGGAGPGGAVAAIRDGTRFRIRSPSCELLCSAASAGVEVCGGGAGDTSLLVPGGGSYGTSGVHPLSEGNNVNNQCLTPFRGERQPDHVGHAEAM